MSEEGKKVLSLMPWDIAVRSATQRKAARALLERDDADEIIRGMTELEVYYALRSLGVDDSVPFLSIIEGEQITALIDLEIWHHERPDFLDLFAWLEGFKEAGLPCLQRAVRTLDIELVAALFRQRLLVAVKPTEEDLDHEIPEWLRSASEDVAPIVETLDRQYLIAARAVDETTGEPFEEEERRTVLRLVEDLYRDEDFSYISRILHIAAHDFSSELEESALRFRNARLEDLGFPPRDRALSVYGPVNVEQVLGTREGPRVALELRLPSVLMEPYARGFLEEVLETIDSPELVREIESELVAVSNAALVADGIEPGNLEGIREVLERARGYLELALRYGAGPSEAHDLARSRLEEHSMRTLFQVGHTLVLRLASRAKKLRLRPALGPKRAFLEEADEALMRVLSLPRPLFLPEGQDADLAEPFRHPEQLAQVARRLDEVEALAELSEALGFQEVHASADASALPPPEEWTFEHMLATLLARRLLGDAEFRIQPLCASELQVLAERVLGGAVTVPDVLARLPAGPLRPSFDRLGRRLEAALTRILQLARSPIDLRFADPILRRS